MTIANNIIATEMDQLYALYSLQSVLQQIYDNLALISEGAQGQVITVNKTSLYTLAAKYYGNAEAWTTIAQANGLTDPMISQLTTLTIPASPIDTGGILNA